MPQTYLVDSPTPFGPTKELQDFLAQWENHPQAQWDPALQGDLKAVRQWLQDPNLHPDSNRRERKVAS
jgi:hypothetical protein